MHEEEILLFTESLHMVNDKFYLDAIKKLETLIDKYPDSDIADDAMYNIALCYFHIFQFNKSIETIQKMIEIYPDAIKRSR